MNTLHSSHHLDPLSEIRKSANPLSTAREQRRRWDYISIVARAAQSGLILDRTLRDVTGNPKQALLQADEAIAELSDFISTCEAHRPSGARRSTVRR